MRAANKEEKVWSNETYTKMKASSDSGKKSAPENKWGNNPFDETPIPTLAKYTINLSEQRDLKVQTFEDTQQLEKPPNQQTSHEPKWMNDTSSHASGATHSKYSQDLQKLTNFAEEDLELLRQSLMPHPHTASKDHGGEFSPADEVW